MDTHNVIYDDIDFKSPGFEGMNTRTIWLHMQDERQSAVYRDYLEQDGYRVLTVNGVKLEPEAGSQTRPDVYLLDDADPLSDMAWGLRSGVMSGEVFVLLLLEGSGEGLATGKVDGLHYLTLKQGVRPRVLSAQIRGILHRTGKVAPKARQFRVGDILIDRDEHFMKIAGQFIDLTPTEFDLLSVFMAAPGEVFSRADLLERTGGARSRGSERTIDVHIRNIRAKIDGVIHPRVVIKTVYRMGYILSNV